MFKYAKRLQYPINIKKKDINMAKQLITQYGGTYYKKDTKKQVKPIKTLPLIIRYFI